MQILTLTNLYNIYYLFNELNIHVEILDYCIAITVNKFALNLSVVVLEYFIEKLGCFCLPEIGGN